jgi:hypothetical protein
MNFKIDAFKRLCGISVDHCDIQKYREIMRILSTQSPGLYDLRP